LATGDWRLWRQKLLSAENFSVVQELCLQKNHSPLATHHSPLAIRYSPLAIRCRFLSPFPVSPLHRFTLSRFPCCPLLLLPRFSLPCFLLRRYDGSKRLKAHFRSVNHFRHLNGALYLPCFRQRFGDVLER